jgi:cell division topological specificity factor
MLIKKLLQILKPEQGSKNIAKERLQLVLINDRSSISPALLDIIKEEIIEVISKHLDIDTSASQINLHNNNGAAILEANLAIKSIKKKHL